MCVWLVGCCLLCNGLLCVVCRSMGVIRSLLFVVGRLSNVAYCLLLYVVCCWLVSVARCCLSLYVVSCSLFVVVLCLLFVWRLVFVVRCSLSAVCCVRFVAPCFVKKCLRARCLWFGVCCLLLFVVCCVVVLLCC